MSDAGISARKEWMSVLAKAAPARLAALMPDLPEHAVLRAPEVGAVMLRGRISTTGAPFNLGEMTVTRCSVRLVGGQVGHAWVQGRDKDHAKRAAVVDALMQSGDAARQRATVIDVLSDEAAARAAIRAGKAAATKVDFFTLVRGEDQ
ncbi:MAG: phosphonate C-P lyase system protein PhnG [Pseudomonadota bacterium]